MSQAQESDSGVYKCLASNVHGNATAPARVIVTGRLRSINTLRYDTPAQVGPSPSSLHHGIFPVLFPHSLSKFSLVYLLAWHPPLHTPYIFTRDSVAIARICHGNSVCPSVCPSVCLSVCLSHGWISQKRLKLGSRNFHHTVAPSL